MKKITSKLAAWLLLACMLCSVLGTTALAAEESITLKKYEKNAWTTITLTEADSTTGAPAGTYYAAPFKDIAIVKQARFAIVFGASEMTDALKTAILAADGSILNNNGSNKVDNIYFVTTSATSYTVNGSNAGTYYFGYEQDGVKYVLAPQGKVSHFLTDVTSTELTDPDPDPTPSDKESKPSLDKDISSDGETYEETTLSAVKPGATVYFRLESQLPSDIETDDDGNATANQTLTFTDTMTGNLTLDTNSIAVKIGENTPVGSNYYTVSEVKTNDDGTKTFTVKLDLTALYNDNSDNAIEETAFNDEAEVAVTYCAEVSADASNGDTFQNEAYVHYKEDSEHSTVTGEVEKDPETGGMGTALFTFTGLGLMAAAGALVLYRRKEQAA